MVGIAKNVENCTLLASLLLKKSLSKSIAIRWNIQSSHVQIFHSEFHFMELSCYVLCSNRDIASLAPIPDHRFVCSLALDNDSQGGNIMTKWIVVVWKREKIVYIICFCHISDVFESKYCTLQTLEYCQKSMYHAKERMNINKTCLCTNW